MELFYKIEHYVELHKTGLLYKNYNKLGLNNNITLF